MDDTVPNCKGLKLGIEIVTNSQHDFRSNYLGQDWSVYTYSGDGRVGFGQFIGNINIPQKDEMFYEEFSFSERDVCWILIYPPDSYYSDWTINRYDAQQRNVAHDEGQ